MMMMIMVATGVHYFQWRQVCVHFESFSSSSSLSILISNFQILSKKTKRLLKHFLLFQLNELAFYIVYIFVFVWKIIRLTGNEFLTIIIIVSFHKIIVMVMNVNCQFSNKISNTHRLCQILSTPIIISSAQRNVNGIRFQGLEFLITIFSFKTHSMWTTTN